MQVHGRGLGKLPERAICFFLLCFPDYNWFLKIRFLKIGHQRYSKAKYQKQNIIYSYVISASVLLVAKTKIFVHVNGSH